MKKQRVPNYGFNFKKMMDHAISLRRYGFAREYILKVQGQFKYNGFRSIIAFFQEIELEPYLSVDLAHPNKQLLPLDRTECESILISVAEAAQKAFGIPHFDTAGKVLTNWCSEHRTMARGSTRADVQFYFYLNKIIEYFKGQFKKKLRLLDYLRDCDELDDDGQKDDDMPPRNLNITIPSGSATKKAVTYMIALGKIGVLVGADKNYAAALARLTGVDHDTFHKAKNRLDYPYLHDFDSSDISAAIAELAEEID